VDLITFEFINVLEYLALLLFCAAEAKVLVLVLLHRRLGFRHGQFALPYCVPVNFCEELVPLDLVSAFGAGAQTAAWVTVQQVYNQVLGLKRHADGQLEDTALDIVEEFGPIVNNRYSNGRQK
jgi:hypothetical protein